MQAAIYHVYTAYPIILYEAMNAEIAGACTLIMMPNACIQDSTCTCKPVSRSCNGNHEHKYPYDYKYP
jgi:hypothetical protein